MNQLPLNGYVLPGALRIAVIDAPPGFTKRLAFVAMALLWKYESICAFVIVGIELFISLWLRGEVIDNIGHEAYLRASLAFDTWGLLLRLVVVGTLAAMCVGVALLIARLLRRACAVVVRGFTLRSLDLEPQSHVGRPREQENWASRATLAVLGGSAPPSIPGVSPSNDTDPSKSPSKDHAGAWAFTLVAPPSIVREPWGGEAHAKLRAFAEAALKQTAPGEVEPIAGRLVPTTLARGLGFVIVMTIGLNLITSGALAAITLSSMGSHVFLISIAMLAAIDSGVLRWASGIVYASPNTCTRVRRLGPNATIQNHAAALIVLHDWNGSGEGLVVSANTASSRRFTARLPHWIHFRLTEIPAKQPQQPTPRRVPGLVHALAAWSNPAHLRALFTPDAPAEPHSPETNAH